MNADLIEPLKLVDRDGHRAAGRIAIAAPVRDGPGARCAVALDGLGGEFDVVGATPLHALIAAVRIVGARLHAYLASGCTAYALDEMPMGDLPGCWLAPAPDLESQVEPARDALPSDPESPWLGAEAIALVSPTGARIAGTIAVGRPMPDGDAYHVATWVDGWDRRVTPIINVTPLFALQLALQFIGFTLFDIRRRGWSILDLAGAPHPIVDWMGPFVRAPVLPPQTDEDPDAAA